MRAIHPYMGTFRRPQIERAIASWHGHRMRWPRTAAPCAASDCSYAGARRGLCVRHYDRWWKAARRGHTTEVAPVDPPTQALGPAGDGAAFDEACTHAWIAGLLEGEGTFSVNRQSADVAYPVIKLEMCDEAVVIRAAQVMGAPSVQRVDPENEDWSPTFVTALTGHHAATWMRRLRSSMGIRRTAAIDAALSRYHPIRLVDPPATCVVPGCGEPHRGRGLCHKHYMMWSRDKAKGREARIAPLR